MYLILKPKEKLSTLNFKTAKKKRNTFHLFSAEQQQQEQQQQQQQQQKLSRQVVAAACRCRHQSVKKAQNDEVVDC